MPTPARVELQPTSIGLLHGIPRRAKALRVAIVSDAIIGRNGVGTYYPDLVQYLRHEVNRVELFAPGPQPDDLERMSIPLPGDSTQRLAVPKKQQLYRRLDELQPHVVVLPSLGGYAYRGLRYAQQRGLPVAVVNHTNFENLLSLYWPAIVHRPLQYSLRSLNRWLCRQAYSVAAMDSAALSEATEAGTELVRVMGTPLAPEFLQTPIVPAGEKIEHALFVGRLAKEKGLELLLQAVRQLPSLHFTIAGDGPLRSMVQRAAQDAPNLSVVGWLSRSQVLQHMDQSQLLLLPSRFETFGTVALEALARRRLVLTSNHCGISKWPMLAAGIFCCEDSQLASEIDRIVRLPAADRKRVAEPSWEVVRSFNANTIRNWVRFLVDSASPVLDTSSSRTPATACRI